MKPLCSHCGRRRATRHCPALGGSICSHCCGEHRLVRIDCSPTCPHLRHNESFQRDKQRLRYREAWGKANADLRDRDADLRLLLVLEGIVFRASEEVKGTTDADLATALADLHTALSPLELVKQVPGSLSRLLIEGAEQIAEEAGSRERVRELAGRIRKVLTLVRDPAAPRAFLQGLATYAEKTLPEALQPSPSGLIVTPDDLRRG